MRHQQFSQASDKMRDSTTRSWANVVVIGLFLIICTIRSDAAQTNVYARKKDKKKSCKEGSKHPECANVEITFESEKIYLGNVSVIPMEDIDALFEIQKDWLETYFREQDRRLRGLQSNDRRRDSRDITTQFEFVRQNSTIGPDGKPTNEVTYNQNIGFGPSSRRHLHRYHHRRDRRSRRRYLVEINVDNPSEVYQVSTRPYRDPEALNELTGTLRENVDSLSSMEGIYKLFDPVRVQSPLDCGSFCEGSQWPVRVHLPLASSSNNIHTDPNDRQRRLENDQLSNLLQT